MKVEHKQLANAIRFLSIDAVEAANSGHPGMPMGMADVATVLFKNFLRFDPKNPSWLNRDRFVLSAGHGSMLLYSLLYLTGYKSINLKDIKNSAEDNSEFMLLLARVAIARLLHSQNGKTVEHLPSVYCLLGPDAKDITSIISGYMKKYGSIDIFSEKQLEKKTKECF